MLLSAAVAVLVAVTAPSPLVVVLPVGITLVLWVKVLARTPRQPLPWLMLQELSPSLLAVVVLVVPAVAILVWQVLTRFWVLCGRVGAVWVGMVETLLQPLAVGLVALAVAQGRVPRLQELAELEHYGKV
jgi:hypothetical protein